MSNLRLLVALTLVAWGGSAVAQTTTIPNGSTSWTPRAGGWTWNNGPGSGWFNGRSWEEPVSRGGPLRIIESNGLAGRAGNLVVTGTRVITALELGSAAVAVGSAFYAGCAAGTTIARWAGMGNGQNNGARVTCNLTDTDWLYDPGVQPIPFTGNTYTIGVTQPNGTTVQTTAAGEAEACELVRQSNENSGRINNPGKTVATTVTSCAPATQGTTVGVNVSLRQVVTGTSSNTNFFGPIFFPRGNVQVSRCPESIDALNPAFNVPAGGKPGPDGKCASGRYNKVSGPEAAPKLGLYGEPGLMADMAEEILSKGGTITSADPRSITSVSPASQTGQPVTTTTTGPNGTTTTTTTPVYNYTWNNNVVNYTENNTTTTVNPGGGTTTTTTTGPGTQPAPEPIETCGLPGKPPCKIDETGTPVAPTWTPEADVDNATQQARDAVSNPEGKFGVFPQINWLFSLPTGCGTIPLPAFEPFIGGLDVCQFMPTFHDVMTVVWLLGGLFGAIGVFWRDQLSSP